MLAKKLGQLPKIHLEFNMLLFDPVPGNLIISGKLDIFNGTLANQCMDLTHSINLRRVLAIYPYLPLPDLAFHAPIIPSYPTHCEVEEDVTLGCHQGAIFMPTTLSTRLSFLRIKTFFEECGTKFNDILKDQYPISLEDCLSELEQECARQETSTRGAHCQVSTAIVRETEGDYLNYHHISIRQKLGLPILNNPRLLLNIRK